MLLSVTKHMTIFQRRHPNGGVITRVIVRWKTGSVIMPNVTARRRQWQWISTVTAIACVFQPSTVACFRDYRWFAVTRRRNYFRYCVLLLQCDWGWKVSLKFTWTQTWPEQWETVQIQQIHTIWYDILMTKTDRQPG